LSHMGPNASLPPRMRTPGADPACRTPETGPPPGRRATLCSEPLSTARKDASAQKNRVAVHQEW
jgi:hypothetical protein